MKKQVSIFRAAASNVLKQLQFDQTISENYSRNCKQSEVERWPWQSDMTHSTITQEHSFLVTVFFPSLDTLHSYYQASPAQDGTDCFSKRPLLMAAGGKIGNSKLAR